MSSIIRQISSQLHSLFPISQIWIPSYRVIKQIIHLSLHLLDRRLSWKPFSLFPFIPQLFHLLLRAKWPNPSSLDIDIPIRHKIPILIVALDRRLGNFQTPIQSLFQILILILIFILSPGAHVTLHRKIRTYILLNIWGAPTLLGWSLSSELRRSSRHWVHIGK